MLIAMYFGEYPIYLSIYFWILKLVYQVYHLVYQVYSFQEQEMKNTGASEPQIR